MCAYYHATSFIWYIIIYCIYTHILYVANAGHHFFFFSNVNKLNKNIYILHCNVSIINILNWTEVLMWKVGMTFKILTFIKPNWGCNVGNIYMCLSFIIAVKGVLLFPRCGKSQPAPLNFIFLPKIKQNAPILPQSFKANTEDLFK